MKIIRAESKDWQDKQGYSKKIFLDENDLNYPGGLVQEIKIKPQEKAMSHYHKKQTEIFYFLTDNGYWIINGEKQIFNIGDVLVIEPFDKHTTINESDIDYTYLAFKFNYSQDDLYWD